MREIEVLIERIHASRNRHEKRSLLAEFNKKKMLTYGDLTYNFKKPVRKISDDNSLEKKVYNKELRTFVDVKDYNEAMKVEKRNPNRKANQQKLTTVMTQNQKLNSINVDVPEVEMHLIQKNNLDREIKRMDNRENILQQAQFLKEHEHKIRAVYEAKRVREYF